MTIASVGRAILERLDAIEASPVMRTAPAALTAVAPVKERKPAQAVPSDDNGRPGAELRGGARKMRLMVARFGDVGLTRAQLGFLAEFAPKGGTFGTYLGDLKRAGLVVEDGGRILVRGELGVALFDAEQRINIFRERLRGGERKMLDELIVVYPAGLSKAQLGFSTGYAESGGTFGTYLGTLRRLVLIDVIGQMVRAQSSAWFPIADVAS
jgi:hypothetical protein